MIAADLVDVNVYVSGRFPGLKKEEVHAFVLGHGGRCASSKSHADAILAADPQNPKILKAAQAGVRILTLEDLGAPLEGYLERMRAAQVAFQEKFATHRKPMVHHFAAGPPADAPLIARIEEEIGFPIPADLRALLDQFNGLSLVGAQLRRGATVDLPDSVMPYAALMDIHHPMWGALSEKKAVTTIGIPDWEEIFLRPAHRRLSGANPHGPGKVLKIGTLKVEAATFFDRLYPFDLYHSYHGAALYADPVARDIKVIHTSDHWADLFVAHPVSLRVYMESLCGMVWHNATFFEQRLIKPLSKTAWPTYIHNVHGAAYVYLQTMS